MYSIKDLTNENAVKSEMLMIKVLNESETRADIRAAADAFEAKTMDYAKDSMIFLLTGESRKIDDFINLMSDYTILEICRTGIVSLEKGSSVMRKITNL